MSESVIIDAVRSPIGIKNGDLVGIRPDDLTAQTVRNLFNRNKNVEPKHIEDLVLGCAFPEGPQGMLMAKGVYKGRTRTLAALHTKLLPFTAVPRCCQ